MSKPGAQRLALASSQMPSACSRKVLRGNNYRGDPAAIYRLSEIDRPPRRFFFQCQRNVGISG